MIRQNSGSFSTFRSTQSIKNVDANPAHWFDYRYSCQQVALGAFFFTYLSFSHQFEISCIGDTLNNLSL